MALAVALLYAVMVMRAESVESPPFFSTIAERPLVIAHQGGEWLRPSNTMLAFENAQSLGVDVLEMDIHSTSDGVLVTIHDRTVDRTTDGSGAVSELNSAEIFALDAGHYWTNDDGLTYPYRGQDIRIATLDEVFSRFPDMPMNIEIKQESPSIGQPFCDLLRQYKRSDLTLVASFSQLAIDEFRAACPEVATSMTASEVTNFFVRHTLFAGQTYTPPASAIQVPEYQIGIQLLKPRFVAASQRRNLQLHAWTINEREDMERMLALGVDGIITDRPDILLELLGR